MPESSKSKTARLSILVKVLKRLFPDAKLALNHSSNLELLIGVILSAQCTDKMVNKVTEKLFKKYPDLNDYVTATQAEFEKDVHSCGYYRNKAKNILATTKRIKEVYGGEVPSTMEDFLTLPGVARKTANVVMGNAFNNVEGVVVDTHVLRFCRRFKLTNKKSAVAVEKDLMKILDQKDWFIFSYLCIEYGRAYKSINDRTPKNDPLEKYLP